MTLRFIGVTSEYGNCPTLYEVVETGDIVVQGDVLTDPGAGDLLVYGLSGQSAAVQVAMRSWQTTVSEPFQNAIS
ncbi:hypothetical protein [Streptomyces sp. NPDC093093]|uniref:hypothetical protein n=1 Tax=Streptomyces sp. NPDC093093 TaxID=3366025 RepID=UPI003817874D